jgi:hypothetical protein
LKAGFVSQKELQAPATNTAAIDSSPANKRKDIQWDLPSEGEGNPVAKKSCTRNDRVQQENEESLQQTDLNRTKDLPMAPAKEPEPVEPLIEAMMAEIRVQTAKEGEGEIFCLEAMYPFREDNEHPLIAFKATSDPDTMYLHEAMKEPDKKEFIDAMHKEVKDQSDHDNFVIMHKSRVPTGATILPTVWQMKRKRNIRTREVKKYKARLNIDGSHMKKGIHYDETYALVVKWNSLRLILTLSALHGWHTKKLDYVLAYPQAPVEKPLYMKIPKGFSIDEGNTDDYVLKVLRNIYGQKQAGRVWNQYLTNKLIGTLGFTQSKTDECVFYRGKTMYALYTDDSILAGPDKEEIKLEYACHVTCA